MQVTASVWLVARRLWFRAALSQVLAAGCLIVVACSDDATSGGATPTYAGPGTLRTIEAGTQMHLDGVALGVGNIWDEEYAPNGDPPRRGLTAGLFISVEGDAAQNRTVRVHPGQDVEVPGYRLHVTSVEPRQIQLAVIDLE
jgi:hypothetical protein